MRKILLFLLLLAGWAIIFWPVYSDELTRSGFLSSGAHPSTNPLPPAWQNSQPVIISSLEGASSFPVTSGSSAANRCGDTYIIQAGEALGEIARDCGISLRELLAANPRISNPNRVYPGQQINLPNAPSGRGGAEQNQASLAADTSPAPVSDGRFRPGAVVKIEAAGLPPNTTVRVGLGLSTVGFIVLGQSSTDAQGRVATAITIPADATPGDTAFIMVSTRGITPAVQRMSPAFQIAR